MGIPDFASRCQWAFEISKSELPVDVNDFSYKLTCGKAYLLWSSLYHTISSLEISSEIAITIKGSFTKYVMEKIAILTTSPLVTACHTKVGSPSLLRNILARDPLYETGL